LSIKDRLALLSRYHISLLIIKSQFSIIIVLVQLNNKGVVSVLIRISQSFFTSILSLSPKVSSLEKPLVKSRTLFISEVNHIDVIAFVLNALIEDFSDKFLFSIIELIVVSHTMFQFGIKLDKFCHILLDLLVEAFTKLPFARAGINNQAI